jgi:hypothetical protein
MGDNRAEIAKCPSVDCPLFAYRKSGTDRGADINSLPITGHIEAVLEHKNGNESNNIMQEILAN